MKFAEGQEKETEGERKSPSPAWTVEEVRVGRTKSSRSIMDTLESLKALRWSSEDEFVVNHHKIENHDYCGIKQSHLAFSFPTLYVYSFSG